MCCIFLLHNGTRQGGNVAKGCLRRDAKCAAKEARREGDAPRYEIATPGGGARCVGSGVPRGKKLCAMRIRRGDG
jgi:hypothetical protein